jgi:hypothetical protein
MQKDYWNQQIYERTEVLTVVIMRTAPQGMVMPSFSVSSKKRRLRHHGLP